MHAFKYRTSEDSLLRAYGSKNKVLLSQSALAPWVEDLWDSTPISMLFSQEAWYSPKSHDKFVSFYELLFSSRI